MPARAMTGWGGSLTFKATGSGTAVAIPVRNVQITRQASEFDLTAHGDTKMYAGPGRVKRGGTLEAYVKAPPSDAEVWYPERWIQNLRLNVRVNKKYSFYTGVDNFTDQLPPLGLIGNEGGNGFDPIGRYWYAGFRADF